MPLPSYFRMAKIKEDIPSFGEDVEPLKFF